MVRILVIMAAMMCGLCRMAMAETVNDPGCRNWLSQIERPSGGTKERVFLENFSHSEGIAVGALASGQVYYIVPEPANNREQHALNVEALARHAWLLRINSPANPKAAPYHIIVGAAGNGCQILSKIETFGRNYRPEVKMLPPQNFDVQRSACMGFVMPHLQNGGAVFPVFVSGWMASATAFWARNGDFVQVFNTDTMMTYTVAVSSAIRGMWEVVYRRDGAPMKELLTGKFTVFEGRVFGLVSGEVCEELAVGPVLEENIPPFARERLGLK